MIARCLPDCYPSKVTLLAAIAMLSCCAIPLLAVVLALSLRRNLQPQKRLQATPSPFTYRARSITVLHPRMDLAAGMVPANQIVDRTRRQHGPTNFAAQMTRLDLVYATADMGDLSDPDLRRTPTFASYPRGTRFHTVMRESR